MAKSQPCLSCLWEEETGKVIDRSRSNVAWANKIGVSEGSIRRHLKHAPASRAEAASDEDAFLRDIGVPIEAVTSRGRSVRDPETGSWQKVTWHPNMAALAETLNYDDLRIALDGYVAKPAPSGKGTHTAVLNASDLQIGKAMNRLGGTPETIERVKASVASFVRDIQENPPLRVLLVDGGDPIENCFNTPAQLVTNDLSVPDQIRTFRRLMLEAIKAIAPHTPLLTYVAVPSNHGHARVGYKSPGGTVDADFGLEISSQLEDAVRENPSLNHVSFVRPESLDEIATVEASGTKLAFHHGHQSSGPNGHGRWWADMAHARHPGWDADILVTAHHHSLRVEQSGNARWIIGVSSSDAGSDWFTNRRGDYAQQGMTAFNVLDGMWSDLRIL